MSRQKKALIGLVCFAVVGNLFIRPWWDNNKHDIVYGTVQSVADKKTAATLGIGYTHLKLKEKAKGN